MFEAWADYWQIPAAARQDFYRRCGALDAPLVAGPDARSESNVSSRVRLAAGAKGYPMWRNNVGALLDDRGVPVRYGLANDSKKANEVMKSGDLIACRPILIQPVHVGMTLGQFTSVEVKHEGWRYTGTAREVAQLNWINRVNSLGGWARFVTSPEQLP